MLLLVTFDGSGKVLPSEIQIRLWPLTLFKRNLLWEIEKKKKKKKKRPSPKECADSSVTVIYSELRSLKPEFLRLSRFYDHEQLKKGGTVANRLRRRTSDQTVLGSNPAVAAALSPWTRFFTPIVPRRSLHISFY